MKPRSRQRRLPKYQPVSPPIRRIGRNACAGRDPHLDRAGVDQTLAVSDAAVALRLQARGGDRVRPAGFGELAVLVRESPRDRLPVAARLDREGATGVRASDDGLVGKAVDQLATDAGVDRGHEPEPEARQAGGEERHRDDPAGGGRAAARTRASAPRRRPGRRHRSRTPRCLRARRRALLRGSRACPRSQSAAPWCAPSAA